MLECPKCKVTYVEPFVLPCGENMCKACIDHLYSSETNGIDCPVCYEFHAMPSKGFLANKIIMRLLEKQPREVYRNKAVDSLKSHINEIKSTMENLEMLVKLPDQKIKQHCDFVRHDVQIVIDSAYAYIDKFREQFMSEIDAYEQKCLTNVSKVVKTKQISADEIKREVDTFIEGEARYLEQYNIEDEKVAKDLDKARMLKNELNSKMLQVRSIIFDGKELVLERNNAALEIKMIGALRYIYVKESEPKHMLNVDMQPVWPIYSSETCDSNESGPSNYRSFIPTSKIAKLKKREKKLLKIKPIKDN